MKKLLLALVLVMPTFWAQANVVDDDTLTARHPEYLPTLKIGEEVPNFTAPDTLGQTISLTDYRGRYVVLDFWASWCGDCRREIPALKELYRDLFATEIDGQRVQWLSLSFDTKAEDWKRILRKEQFPWPQVSNLKSTREEPTFKNFGLNWIPAFLIIDPQGKLVATAITAEGLRKELLKLFNEKNISYLNLWPERAPTSSGITDEENFTDIRSGNITQPTLTIYRAKQPNGKAVLACPGGGYIFVYYGGEGHNLAKWYNDQGITYAVLKYRLPNGHKEIPLDDIHEAMRILRSMGEEYGFTKIGVQGCSAGGHLASTAATHYNSAAERPDFQILFYPVISMDASFTHKGSRDFLLGNPAKPEDVEMFSNEKQVTPQTPPAFIMANTDDNVVPVRNSIDYYTALVRNHVPAALHVYPTGGHGWCDKTGWVYRSQWMNELQLWLQQLNF